jgi:NAD-dependent SIR2 family protein deacetylase
MGRKRKPNLEVEYELERTVDDLKQQLEKLTKRIKQLEKVEKQESYKKEEVVIKKKVELKNECPKCGAVLKTSVLPFGSLLICETGCGFREVKR